MFPYCRYGKLSNGKPDEQPYMFSVMQTKSHWSSGTYMPYLKVADDIHLSTDDMGQRLIYEDKYIECNNNKYVLKTSGDEIIDTVFISQNDKGIDREDRIVKLCEYIKNLQ